MTISGRTVVVVAPLLLLLLLLLWMKLGLLTLLKGIGEVGAGGMGRVVLTVVEGRGGDEASGSWAEGTPSNGTR